MADRWWFVLDTAFVWVIVVVSCGILLAHPLPHRWLNISLGILTASEALLWLWMLGQRRRDPPATHKKFLRIAMALFVAIILVASRGMWG